MRNGLKSLLFVPARQKMIQKIGTLEADAYIIDLEDSIEDNMKMQALNLVQEYLEMRENTTNIYIRVNKDNFKYELESLRKFPDVGFMLPKFDNCIFYETCVDILKVHEVIALVETPKGIINIKDIVKCSWIDGVAFGAEDYTACVGMKNDRELLRYQKSRLIAYTKAYEKVVYDTPSFQLSLNEEAKKDIEESANFGFDGKLIINPKHIQYINNSFERMCKEENLEIIKQYESSGKAVQVINGKVYEKMHIESLKKIGGYEDAEKNKCNTFFNAKL